MAYSRNKYKLIFIKKLPKESKLIDDIFYESLEEFLKNKNICNEVVAFYLLIKDGNCVIITEFKDDMYLAIKLLEETNDKDSIQTKDEIFFISEV
jgi:hypothetical protein